MPRFFFHIFNGNGETPDEDGLDLADQAAAHRIAVDSIRSIVAEEARQGMIDVRGHIAVENAAGDLLLRVDFVEAFELRLPTPKVPP